MSIWDRQVAVISLKTHNTGHTAYRDDPVYYLATHRKCAHSPAWNYYPFQWCPRDGWTHRERLFLVILVTSPRFLVVMVLSQWVIKRGLELGRKENKYPTTVQGWSLAIEHGTLSTGHELFPHKEATMGRKGHSLFLFLSQPTGNRPHGVTHHSRHAKDHLLQDRGEHLRCPGRGTVQGASPAHSHKAVFHGFFLVLA